MKLKLPPSTHNWTSLTGAMIALVSLAMIIFLFVVSVFLEEGRTYLGLVIYIILPVVLIFGLVLIPLGMILKIRKDKAGKSDEEKWPLFNLNDVRQRNASMIFVVGTAIYLFLSAIGSYEAFNYTESVEFCGTLCHSVMNPEYTAYKNSPHAKVACVECHVGEGVDWYVRSKMSGLHQVYAVTFNTFEKPIPTPIRNLRPARETCETCHWPQKFYARKLRLERHYLSDEENTEWDIQLIMKIGASHSALGLQEGIHWHINPNVKIEYKASDYERETIPWVKYTNLATGEEKVFIDEDNGIEASELDTMETRLMDCMDCHTRPSHNYQPPAFFVNNAITSGDIPRELPEIKSLAMDICSEEFPTTDSAMAYIRQQITEYYTDYDVDSGLVEKAITGLQDEFKKNIFPEMKVRWDAYPNHIGHLEFNGCFRCHNDTHTTETGEVISRNCNLCHTINAQGKPDSMMVAQFNQGLEFIHPVDIEGEWKESLCTDCHTGLNP